MAGRTYVHSSVKKIIINNSYKMLEVEQPNKVFKYAETGFKEGVNLHHIKMVWLLIS